MRLPWKRQQPLPDVEPWARSWRETATEADIIGCFRLLLGRNPNAEEWRGHSMRVGERLDSVVASYMRSLEFERRGLLTPSSNDAIVIAETQDFTIYTHADDAAVGKHVRDGNYERDVTAVFQAELRPGMSVVDIGANVGYFTLLAAKLVGPEGYVLAVEPNPRNARLLEASRRANSLLNVTIAQVAAGQETGILSLNTSFSNGTTSGLPSEMAQLIAAESVPSIRLDALLDRDNRIDFIKVDVEGAEYNALRGGEATIRRWHPLIVSEFSPSMMPGISGVTGEAYLRWLIDLGYDLAVVDVDGSLIEVGADIAAVMRIYQTRMSDHIDLVAKTGAAASSDGDS